MKKIKITLMITGIMLFAYTLVSVLTLFNNIGNYLPGILGIFLFLIGFFYDKIIMRKTKGFLKFVKCVITAGIIIFVTTFLWMCALILYNSWHIPEQEPDALIVLGAGLKGDQVTITLSERLDKAKEYFDLCDSKPIIVVSGGQGPNETVTEAKAMKDYLISKGIDEGQILTEDKSSSTKQNMLYTKRILDGYFGDKDYKVAFVTSDFHVVRSGIYAKIAGLKAEGISANTPFYMIPNYYLREYLALSWSLVELNTITNT